MMFIVICPQTTLYIPYRMTPLEYLSCLILLYSIVVRSRFEIGTCAVPEYCSGPELSLQYFGTLHL